MQWSEWRRKQTASAEEYTQAGHAARKTVPRSAQAEYTGSADRDPLGIIEQQNATRIQELVPLRMQRMSASAFAFYRGTAAIQAADLAGGPHTGRLVVACGDAHVNNFGVFAAPDRSMVFDMNDFDEAAPAPWEWDVKRLATSATLAARENGFAPDVERAAAELAARAYRSTMRTLTEQSALDRFYVRWVVSTDALQGTSAKAMKRTLRRAERRTSQTVAERILERNPQGEWRFREDPPVLTRLQRLDAEQQEKTFAQYLATASPDVKLLLLQYEPLDIVRRVVGVGSVGTACFIGAFKGPTGDPLILQMKEAGHSVLMTYGKVGEQLQLPEVLATHLVRGGERVVTCQRMLQATSDPFLGYVTVDERDFYVRQFRDRNTGIDLAKLDEASLFDYVRACGATLARGHAQSPGASFIAAYLGSGDGFDRAIGQWSLAYAAQAEADYQAFVAAIESGRFPS